MSQNAIHSSIHTGGGISLTIRENAAAGGVGAVMSENGSTFRTRSRLFAKTCQGFSCCRGKKSLRPPAIDDRRDGSSSTRSKSGRPVRGGSCRAIRGSRGASVFLRRDPHHLADLERLQSVTEPADKRAAVVKAVAARRQQRPHEQVDSRVPSIFSINSGRCGFVLRATRGLKPAA